MITTTTRKAKLGKKICSQCGEDINLCEMHTEVNTRNEVPYKYIMEFSLCEGCGQDYVLQDSIIKNEERARIAKKEATVAYKMKKWLNKE